MANNISVLDSAAAAQVVKTTDTAGVHTPHHNVDSSALPTGAATAAKQPALGTAGSASTDVITIQGIAAGTPVLSTLTGTNNIATVTTVTGVTTVSTVTAVTTVSTVTNLSQLGGTAIAMGTGVRSSGTQRVTIATDDVVPISDNGGSITVDGTVAVSGTVTVGSHAVTNAGTFVIQVDGTALTRLTDIETNTDSLAVVGAGTAAAAQRVTIASDAPTINVSLATETSKTIGTVQGIATALPAGTNAIGKLAANSGVDIGDVDVVALTGSTIAHDAADSGNPHKVGGRAVTAEITAIANNDRSDFVTDKVGKQIVLPYANPENFVSGATAAMTGTTSTSLIAAGGSGLFNYITQITVSNSHATVGTDVEIQDGNGGTTFYVIPAAAVYGGATLTFPTPLKQPTSNTALYVKNTTTGASTRVSASGYKGV